MKKILKLAIVALGISLVSVIVVNAQVTNNTWKVTSNLLQPVLNTWGVQVPSLGSGTTTCITSSPIGVFGTTTCGSGGGSPINTNPFQATYFTATSTTATSTFPIASSTCFWNGTNCLVSSSGGTVTSVAMTTPTGLSISGSPINTSGTLALSLTAGYTIPQTFSVINWNGIYNSLTTNTPGYVLQASSTNPNNIVWVSTSSLGFAGGTNYFTNSGATTSLSTGNVVSASNGYFGLVTATTSMKAPFYDIPTTLSSTQGVITQNGVPIINMYNTGGNQNVFLGTSAGNFNSSNSDNVAVGRAALNQSTNAYGDMAIGDSALYSNTTGTFNVALGKNALSNNISGSSNFSAVSGLTNNTTGNNNIGVGSGSVGANQGGSYNISFGYQPISLATTLNYDIGIGWRAGYSLFGSSGIDNNIFIGTQSDVTTAASTSMSQSIAIGYMAKVGCSYCMALGGTGSNAVNVGIGVTNPTTPLVVNGTASVSNIVSSSTATSTFAGSVQVTAGTILNNEYTAATSSSMTLSWLNGTQQLVKLGHAAVTINFSGVVAGGVLRLPVCQDSTGGATVTWDSRVLWASSTPPTLSGANHCDLMTFDSTNGTSSLIILGGYTNF